MIKKQAELGDVYITKFRKFYGAFKVINKGFAEGWEDTESLLVVELAYFKKEKPLIASPELKQFLYCNRFDMDNEINANYLRTELTLIPYRPYFGVKTLHDIV